jgi:hypothetical protein
MSKREFTDLEDLRLLHRGNKILGDLFRSGVHSIRQSTQNESDAKGFYRFLQNDRVSEDDIVGNMINNCRSACQGKYVVCIQDTTEVNLSSHSGRIKKDGFVGTTNANKDKGLGFFLHPSLVVDAQHCIPYGYADIKVWNRSLSFQSKHERDYNNLPIEQKESYKWLEVSKNTKATLSSMVSGMIIVQDREGDIYDQFCEIPDSKTDLLIRAQRDRVLADKSKLFACLSTQQAQGTYEIIVDAKNRRPKRKAKIEVRFKQVELKRPSNAAKHLPSSVFLYLIEAREVGYKGEDAICWRLLTTIPVGTLEVAKACIEWYSWRWMIEEVFKVLKKEGYDIESSELEYVSSVRKMSLMILEVVIQLFLMRLSYEAPEIDLSAESCFTQQEQEFIEQQVVQMEGKTSKQQNPYRQGELKRCVWVIARLGGWKGYESKRHPGITTLWTGLKLFKAAFSGWIIHRNVSTR